MTEENQIEIALSDRQPASECAEEKNAVSEEKSSLSAEKEESCTECVSEKDGEKAIETVENPKEASADCVEGDKPGCGAEEKEACGENAGDFVRLAGKKGEIP